MTRRLVSSYVAVTVLVLAALALPLGHIFTDRERDRLLRDVEHDAVVVASLVEDALERGTAPSVDQLLADYARDTGGRIVVVDSRGRSLADSDPDAATGDDFSNRSEIATALAGRRAEGTRYSKTAGGNLVFVAIPVTSSANVFGAVRITYPAATLVERVHNLWLAIAALGALAILLSGIVGFGLARLVTRPVAVLTLAAHRIADGDLSARAPTDLGAPELRSLATAFNHSAERVQTLLASQQAFVADASHQLRTPLAALRLQLENVEARAPVALQPDLAAARAETARLTQMSESLLELARAPASAGSLQPTELVGAVCGRVEAWSAAANELAVRFQFVGPSAAWTLATPGALDQMLDNLFDNALVAAPAGSIVDVSVVVGSETTEVHVADRGHGLTDEQRTQAFARFWRGPDAGPGGTGLGLAIVEQLARACGGNAELRSRDGGGTDAVVVLRTFTLP